MTYRMIPPKPGRRDKFMEDAPRSPSHARAQRWYKRLYTHTPPWCPVNQILAIYKRAQRLRRLGCKVEVDHIVPLGHPDVCGLHVPWNLEIRSKAYNQFKSNKFWPGYLFGQEDMFGNVELEQGELSFQPTKYRTDAVTVQGRVPGSAKRGNP